MIKEIIATGKDVVEAKENARAALGAGPLDDVNFEILHAGSRGIFGIIGVKPAQVKAYMEIPDAEERHKRKSERPKREQKAPEVKTEEKKTEKVEKTEKTEKKSEPQSQKKKPQKKTPQKKAENKDNKQKSKVIPETELKLTPKEVTEGEDMSYDFIKTLISDIGLSAEASLYTCEDGTRRIVIAGDDASTLIGHHGDTLDALQYLANLACARKNIHGERDKSRVTIDIEGYRAKREETLRALARRMAAKALKNRRSVMLEPMSAYERRIIHSEIQNIDGVSTNSIGADNNRKIVIYLTDKKPQGIFEEDKCDSEAVDTDAVSVEAVDNNTSVTDSDEEAADVINTAFNDSDECVDTPDEEDIK